MPLLTRPHPLLSRLGLALVLGLPMGLWVDKPVERLFHGAFGPVSMRFLTIVTDVGLAGWWFLFAGLGWAASEIMLKSKGAEGAVWQANVRAFHFMLSSLIVGGLAVTILKFVFGRYRPKAWFDEGLYGLVPFSGLNSFPSGHAQAIFTAMTALAIIHPAGRRWYMALAFTVAVSRVLLGLHYPGDIMAGAVLGSVSALAVKGWYERRGLPTPALRSPTTPPTVA